MTSLPLENMSLVDLVTSMTSQSLKLHEVYDKDYWDDVGSALANTYGTRVLYLQNGQKPALEPFQSKTYSQTRLVCGGYTWKITRESDKTKLWSIWTRDDVLIATLNTKRIWTWIKNQVDTNGCYRVANREVFLISNTYTPTEYACAFLEEIIKNVSPCDMFPDLIWQLREKCKEKRNENDD